MLSSLSYSSIVSYAQDTALHAANARSFIWYNMDGFTKSIDGTISLINKGSAGSRLNAEAFASNHIYLNGKSVPYVITSGIEVCYYDVSTKAFVKDTASNPYTMTTSHSSLFSSTITITDADLAELTADPNKLYRIWFGSETLESGFDKTDIGNFYGGNEGLAGGLFVQDLSIDKGAENIINGTFPTGVANWNTTRCTIAWESANKAKVTRTEATGSTYIDQTQNLEIGKLYLFTTKFEVGTITAGTFDLNIFTSDWGVDWVNGAPSVVYSELGNGIVQGWFIPSTTSVKFLVVSENSNLNEYFFVGDISTREASAVEIQAYDSATRTTLANQPDGASNLKLVRDGSGRATGIAATNTTQWEADGRTAVTNWTITAPFTIGELIDGVPYLFTSDGNRFKNLIADGTYTVPTGIWTLDEFGFDGVTPVTVRGTTGMHDKVLIP